MALHSTSQGVKVPRLLSTVSAHVILVDQGRPGEGAKILLGRLAYRDHRWRKWSFPGGYVDHGERPEDALCREVEEETGVRLLSWEQVHVMSLLHMEQPHISFLFRCDQWQGSPACLTREFLEVQWADEGSYGRFVREESLAYPCMRDQVSFLGWQY